MSGEGGARVAKFLLCYKGNFPTLKPVTLNDVNPSDDYSTIVKLTEHNYHCNNFLMNTEFIFHKK